MADDEWIMVHKNRAGDTIDELKTPNITFTKRHKEPGDIAYDVALSEPTMRWAFAGPKRTIFELWNTDYDVPIISGIHSYINTRRGEEVLHVQGKTWLWYLQNRHYPFNPQAPNAFLGGTAANDQGLAYQQFGEPTVILQEIWDIIMARPNSDFGLTLISGAVGIDVGYRIELGDTRSLFDMITELSEIEPGFDFFDLPTRLIFLVAPAVALEGARTNPALCIHTFDRFTPPTEVTDIEFENSGPEGTHILALGAGTSSRIGRAYGYDQSQEQFGRWDMTKEFSDTMSVSRLVALAQAYFSKGLYPQHGLPMEVKPDGIKDFWSIFYPGQPIWIRENFESNHVEGANIILEMQAQINTQGESRVLFDLEQFNKRGRPGSVQA